MSIESIDRAREEVAKRYQAVIETAIDGIIVIDSRGIVELINPAGARMFGYPSDEICGHNISLLMPSPHREQHDAYLERYLRTRTPHIIGIGRESSGLRKDGKVFPIRLSVTEVNLGDRIIFTGIIQDLSEVKKAEEKIKKLNEELEQKVYERTEKLAEVVNKLLETNKLMEHEVRERKAVAEALRVSEAELRQALEKEKELSDLKTRFVSMASHEFRTPLSTILSSAALIGRYPDETQQTQREKHIQRIKSAVSNLNGILNDFLSLSKLEEGKVDNQPETFDLKLFLLEVIDEMQGLLKSGQQIITDISPSGETSVFLDKRLLKNIFFNLLSNAIKYSGEGKPVLCSVDIQQEQLEVRIEDKGIGIPDAEQGHLFTRFFRASNSMNYQGTGLGLNIVLRYVTLMSGTIHCKSILDKGSVFTLVIPFKPTGDDEKNIGD